MSPKIPLKSLDNNIKDVCQAICNLVYVYLKLVFIG